MATTKSKNAYKISKIQNETDDDTPFKTKTIDFSGDKYSIKMTIIQLIGVVIFMFGIGWFVASQWVFETKSTQLRSEIKDNLNDFRKEILEDKNKKDLKDNETRIKLDNLENLFRDLKQRNSYLK